MSAAETKARTGIIAATTGLIALAQYVCVSDHFDYPHFVFHALFFMPLILAAFWFGLRGALATSLAITLLNIPEILLHFQHPSILRFELLLQIILYNVVAVSLGVLKDREARRQKRVIETENLAAMGRAIAGVAHDMKTPLIAIGGFSRLLQRRCGLDDPCREKVDIILRESQRLEKMVADMLDFSRPLSLSRSEEDVARLIEECLAVVREAARSKGVDLRFDAGGDIPPVSLDAARIKQVIINLVMNAVQATPEGDEVRILGRRKEEGLVIEVCDKGCGIPPEKMEEVFTPFFTTKRDGTGLGLPIARKIVEAHQGKIEVLSNPEKGLTFRITLPT